MKTVVCVIQVFVINTTICVLSLYTLVHAFAFVYTRACVRPCLCAPVPVYVRGCVHPYLGASAPEWVRVQSPSVCMARVHFVYTSYKHL